MKLPLSWMRDFVSVDAPVEEISRRLSYAGLVVENVEKLTPGFAGVYAARVVNVEKHPNADRLNLCDGRFADGDELIHQTVEYRTEVGIARGDHHELEPSSRSRTLRLDSCAHGLGGER